MYFENLETISLQHKGLADGVVHVVDGHYRQLRHYLGLCRVSYVAYTMTRGMFFPNTFIVTWCLLM